MKEKLLNKSPRNIDMINNAYKTMQRSKVSDKNWSDFNQPNQNYLTFKSDIFNRDTQNSFATIQSKSLSISYSNFDNFANKISTPKISSDFFKTQEREFGHNLKQIFVRKRTETLGLTSKIRHRKSNRRKPSENMFEII